nr:hypothetical protein [Tanacetum cinerariifolium]
KKRATLIVIPSIRFTKLIIHHLQRKHRFHPRHDSPLHLSNEEPVLGYLKFSAKGSTQDLLAPKLAKPSKKPQSTAQKAPPKPSISSPVASTQPAPTSALAKSQENKCKHATGTTNKPAKAKRIKRSISRKTCQPRSSPKSIGMLEAEEVPAEEPQVADEDADYQKAMEESMKDAYALPKDSEEESKKIVLKAEKGGQDEGQAGPDPDAQDEDQTRPDAGAQAEGHVRSNPDETSEGQAGSNPDETSEG